MLRVSVFLKRGEDRMLIEIMYNSGVYDRVSAQALDRLLKSKEVVKFLRSDGWVQVGQDPVRGRGRTIYRGPERRITGPSLVQ
jgi:hypothetical protein